MPKSAERSVGLSVVLLLILALLVLLGSVFFFARYWMNPSMMTRPVTTVTKTKTVNQAVSNLNVQNTESDETSPSTESQMTVTAPAESSKVTSPITITGSAPGTWFFEASFPVRLEDTQGTVLAQSYAQAVGEWMTEGLVEFTSTVTYSVTERTDAVLIFQPDDPSGLGTSEEFRLTVVLLP